MKEVLYEGLTRGEKDFKNALVTKIRASGAEVVYFGGLHPEAGPLVRQMREQGLTAKFLSGDGIVTDELVIRYNTRDLSSLYYDKCECGRTTVRMEKSQAAVMICS